MTTTRETNNRTAAGPASNPERYLRTEFLRALAHGLRSPLTVARGALSELPNSPSEDVEFLANMAQRSLMRITRMAEQLDWLSELESQLTSVRPERCEARTLVNEAVMTSNLGNLQLTLNVSQELPLDVDRVFMLRALSAVLDNARRFGKHEVRVSADIEDDHVVLRVEDDGPGILPERRSMLFDPYISARHRGADTDLALGLPLAHAYVALHGGSMELGESPLGGLSCRMRLPRELGQEPA